MATQSSQQKWQQLYLHSRTSPSRSQKENRDTLSPSHKWICPLLRCSFPRSRCLVSLLRVSTHSEVCPAWLVEASRQFLKKILQYGLNDPGCKPIYRIHSSLIYRSHYVALPPHSTSTSHSKTPPSPLAPSRLPLGLRGPGRDVPAGGHRCEEGRVPRELGRCAGGVSRAWG